ncbi:MAG: bifunctional pyr operon transcriptional regulator/uracil phosphoribosyltransferase PyrR [Phycisphaerae bacterium]|nr:bifunctional pyr operon transcriptional regulator/uracil phosphoribosyltransferase PyrR [Phycisphaerae bacterium]
MKVIMDAQAISRSLDDLTERIAATLPDGTDFAVIGIRSRGEVLAQRLAGTLAQRLGRTFPCGTLDITLYRDDLNEPKGKGQPQVRTTEIVFDINDKIIILIDDVLYTGRSARAAMDALIDLGRPKAIRLAVLIDRGHHELPIQADFQGRSIDVGPEETVRVRLTEMDGTDQVIVE